MSNDLYGFHRAVIHADELEDKTFIGIADGTSLQVSEMLTEGLCHRTADANRLCVDPCNIRLRGFAAASVDALHTNLLHALPVIVEENGTEERIALGRREVETVRIVIRNLAYVGIEVLVACSRKGVWLLFVLEIENVAQFVRKESVAVDRFYGNVDVDGAVALGIVVGRYSTMAGAFGLAALS